MKYFKISSNLVSGINYEKGDTLEEVKNLPLYRYVPGAIFTEITKDEYDLYNEKQRLIKLAETGQLNTMLTTYFNSIYRRANNLPDSFYEHLTVDGKARTKKQVLNSVAALAVDSKYLIAFEGTDGFITIEDGIYETFLKDVFAIEDNYRTNKNPEWLRLVAILTVQEYIEEKFTQANSSIIRLIHQLIHVNLQGTDAHAQIPDLSGIDLGALVSGGTT